MLVGRMRLLVVGFADSVHIARYLRLLDGTPWEVHLFQSRPGGEPHPELPEVAVHAVDGEPELFAERVDRLEALIRELEPDVVHAHEIQHAGALVDAVRERPGLPAFPWVVTNWGSDILWFGRDPVFAPRIRRVMEGCDYFGAECHRDVALARSFGFRGTVLGVWPVAGGIDPAAAAALRTPGPTSGRRALSVKGAVGAIGRGEVAFEAVVRCRDLLAGWEVCGAQMQKQLGRRYAELAEDAGFTYTELSGHDTRQSSHDDLLAMHGRSRVSLGLNLTDALSTSFVEAMALGSFPVQSRSSCGGEITPPGRGALFVSPTDVDEVAAALRRALTDDALVDAAADINARAVAEHLDRRRTRARVLDAYDRIVSDVALRAVA